MIMQDSSRRLNLIALSPNFWSGPWMNRQYLLTRLGRRHNVVYSTGAWTVWERGTEPWKRARVFGRVTSSDNVIVEEAPRFLLRWPKHELIDSAALYLHSQRLRRLAAKNGTGPAVAMLFHPSFYPYLRFLRPRAVAYHAYDLFSGMSGWNPRLEAMEDDLLRKADLVSAVSPAIADSLSRRVHREIRILPNGVDLEAFDRDVAAGESPADIDAIPRPRLGYVGSLHPQVDFGLIASLAEQRPNYHFVLVGGRPDVREDVAEAELERCRARGNVHFLGEKDRSLVPGYLRQMDVNLMLYRLSVKTWIPSIYPLKLHEYLAAGKPIVSVDLAAVRPFSSVVRIARDLGEWLAALDDAVKDKGAGSENARREVARQNGWDARAGTLENWLVQVTQARADAGADSDMKGVRA